MRIKNVKVYTEDKKFIPGEVSVSGGKFSADPADDGEVLDGEGCYMIPGLVDIHFHGCVGDDFCDAKEEGIANMAKYEASVGVTSICPATMTLSEEELHNIMKTAGAYRGTEGAKLVGINMEGPFIDPKKKGAHEESYIHDPSIDFFRECNEACDHRIKLVTMAPNQKNGMEFIEKLHEEVCISMGHTSMGYDTAVEAIQKGAHHVTHLFNAMQPFAHRDPGLVGAAFDDPECAVELISDGFHIHPSVIRSVFTLFGSDRVVLISDSMMATGMAYGRYKLGDLDVTMKDRKATLQDGTLAGSATNLFDCMRCAVSFGVPREQAIFAATRNPARSIGVYDRVGSLTPGKDADILLVDKDLNLKKVISE